MSDSDIPRTVLTPEQVTLLQMVYGAQTAQIIYVATRLGVADILRDAQRTSSELAAAVGVDENALRRLLRALVSLGVCAEVEVNHFALPRSASISSQIDRTRCSRASSSTARCSSASGAHSSTPYARAILARCVYSTCRCTSTSRCARRSANSSTKLWPARRGIGLNLRSRRMTSRASGRLSTSGEGTER